MIDNMTQQQRMVLALVLSLLFFVVYDYFMPKPKRVLDQNHTSNIATTANTTTSNRSAPTQKSNAAPQQSSTVSTPTSNSNNSIDKKIIAKVESDEFRLSIDQLGRIASFEVLNEQFKSEDGSYPNLISDKFELKPLEIRFNDTNLNSEAFTTPYESDKTEIKLNGNSQTLVLTQKLSNTEVKKEITFNQDGTYKIKTTLSNMHDYFISPGFRPDVAADMYTFKGALIDKSDGTIETIEDGDAKGNEVFMGAKIVAASDKYYTTSLYSLENGLNVYISKDSEDRPLAFVKGVQNLDLNGYIGPKEYDKLNAINPELTKIIEYGFFTFIAKPVFIFLKYLYSILGNWGWAIVAITIIIRLILYPLTYKGMVSMNRLKELSPKIKEIQKKYKGEPQKMNAKMMELYKKHNANPMGGCLPMLLQIPVFFAIYRVLQNTIELKHAEWIAWYHDLSVMDPYYVLPILMGASMLWQQKITPTNYTDPMQEKIMKFLPVIFTFFFITFPAGLTLYWFTNNLFSVAQQYYVNSLFAKEKAKKAKS